tara:strand:+ start:20209 stop:21153 length:945 start_codon:yes stop_codon:yes gene_type:complete
MALLNGNFSAASDSVDIEEIYQECLYNPTSFINDGGSDFRHTFEAFNGGLTAENIADSELSPETTPNGPQGQFTSETFRSGSFARGYFFGFNFPDRYHPAQFTMDNGCVDDDFNPENQYSRTRLRKRFMTPSYSLSANVFIPWDCVVYVTYQGFFASNGICASDATDASGTFNRKTYIGDFYVNRLYIDGEYRYGTEVRTPPSRRKQDPMTIAFENRFRWHHKAAAVHLTKGYHDFSVLVGANIISNPDKYEGTAKQQVFCGSISILSIKSGKQEEDDGTLEWYGRDYQEPPPPAPPKPGQQDPPPPPPPAMSN